MLPRRPRPRSAIELLGPIASLLCSTVWLDWLIARDGCCDDVCEFLFLACFWLARCACLRFLPFADILDPALLRPGRLDRKIEIPLPNETSRLDIFKIHSASITKRGEIDFESIVKVSKRKRGMLGRLRSERAKIRTFVFPAWVVVHTLDEASLRLAVWRAAMGVYAQFHTRFLTRPFIKNGTGSR